MKTTLTVLLIVELCRLSSSLIIQHFFVNDEETWDSARRYCQSNFHLLSIFPSEYQQQNFLEYAADQTSDAWVGLYTENGVWKWLGGENATEINWDVNQPDLVDGCAFLYRSRQKLHDANCSAKYAFFCMNISEFVLVRQNETWEGALEYCRTHFNDLASLSTASRMSSALPEIALAQTEYVWTGLRYLAGHWFWLNGDNFQNLLWYQMILPQCPARDRRCGALNKQSKLWTHSNCEEKFHFICQ
ncbi:hypothetical protein QQF64_033643 [Cirrhinus molitorella]|uniref:C-type lectin domain-containing protein n=1 Tax=Cirrhinus molitorella TaxID=172907 RepID=A0ABR3MUH1_9TELE